MQLLLLFIISLMVKQLKVEELTATHREYSSHLNNEILNLIWSLKHLTEYYSTSDIKNPTFKTLNTVFGLKRFLTTHCGNNKNLYSFFKDSSKDISFSLGIQVNGKIPTGSHCDYTRLDIPNVLYIHIYIVIYITYCSTLLRYYVEDINCILPLAISRGNTTPGIVPPVLQTPSGPRQGPDRPSKKERHAANERSSIKELEAMQ
jgi:hypothetical protein